MKKPQNEEFESPLHEWKDLCDAVNKRFPLRGRNSKRIWDESSKREYLKMQGFKRISERIITIQFKRHKSTMLIGVDDKGQLYKLRLERVAFPGERRKKAIA